MRADSALFASVDAACRPVACVMRIVIVCPNYYGPPWKEGVANLTRRLGEHLAAKDEVTVVSPNAGTGRYRMEGEIHGGRRAGRLSVVRVGGGSPWAKRATFWPGVLGWLRVNPPAARVILFASASRSLPARIGLVRRASRAPLLVYVTGLGVENPPIFRNTAAERITVISPYLLRWFPDAEVVYPFVRTELAGTEPPMRVNGSELPFRFLYLGALEPERGVECLVRGFGIATKRAKRDLRLTIALNGHGRGAEAELRRLLGECGVESAVHLDGVVDIRDAYGEADAVVIPRAKPTRMSFPVRILEALSMRRPLIVTTMCEMGNLIAGCGMAVPANDPQALAAAMVSMADEPRQYAGFVANCRAANERYDSDVALQQMQRHIGDLVLA